MLTDQSQDQLLHSLQVVRALTSRLEGAVSGTLALLVACGVCLSVRQLLRSQSLPWRRWFPFAAGWRLHWTIPPDSLLLFLVISGLISQFIAVILLHCCSSAIDAALESAKQLPRLHSPTNWQPHVWLPVAALLLLGSLLILAVLRLKQQRVGAATMDVMAADLVSCLGRAADYLYLVCSHDVTTALRATSATPVSSAVTSRKQVRPADGADSGWPEHWLCVVCHSEQRCVLLLPCRHFCLCKSCSRLLDCGPCPVCRSTVSERLPVYV